MLQRTCIVSLLLVSSHFRMALAQGSALEAELPKALTAAPLTAGSSFPLKVTRPWQDGRCLLSPGEVLHAVVQQSEHNAKGKVTSISFQIEVACADEKPVHVVVTSLLAPVEEELLSQQFFHGPSFGGGTSSASSGIKTGDTPDMSGRQNAQLPFSGGTLERSDRPKAVHLGDVYHLSHVKLAVPAPGAIESTISGAAAGLSLPARTTFILQASRMERQAAALVSASLTTQTAPSQRTRHALISACLTGKCTKQNTATISRSLSGAHLLSTGVDLAPFGFRSEGDREFKNLDDGATVHFLGDEQILVTFPSHQLVRRPPGMPGNVHPRSVRAVALDASTLALQSVQNWEIQDGNPYIWPLARQVVVHTGEGLSLLGPGIRTVASFPLDAPLAAVRMSPDGNHLLVGRVRELHTPDEHNMLVQTDARGPEEEVRWEVLDGQLTHAQSLGMTSSFRLAPVLMNEGLLELRKEGVDRYHLVLQGWGLGPQTQMGSFDSTCLPTLENTQPDLLLLSTCDARDLGSHSFFLHDDGTPVLDETFDWHDLPMASVSASDTHRVAFMVTRGKEEYTRGKAFHLSSLRSQSVEVVDAQNGAVVAVVPSPSMSPYRHIVALSPDGQKLAVLCGKRLFMYELQ